MFQVPRTRDQMLREACWGAQATENQDIQPSTTTNSVIFLQTLSVGLISSSEKIRGEPQVHSQVLLSSHLKPLYLTHKASSEISRAPHLSGFTKSSVYVLSSMYHQLHYFKLIPHKDITSGLIFCLVLYNAHTQKNTKEPILLYHSLPPLPPSLK